MRGQARSILRKYHVSITRTRLLVLEFFLASNNPLTRNDFHETDGSHELNRISIFRTLKLFVEKNIIYRVHATDRVSRYLLRQFATNVHANFICSVCKKVMPLTTIDLPEVELPENFTQQNMEIIIEGLCNDCKSSYP